jgi:hypothetical protein
MIHQQKNEKRQEKRVESGCYKKKLECPVLICVNDLFTTWIEDLRSGHQEKGSLYTKHKEK